MGVSVYARYVCRCMCVSLNTETGDYKNCKVVTNFFYLHRSGVSYLMRSASSVSNLDWLHAVAVIVNCLSSSVETGNIGCQMFSNG